MKLWKGRFSKEATSSSDEFNASIPFDQRMYEEDITGSIAHAGCWRSRASSRKRKAP